MTLPEDLPQRYDCILCINCVQGCALPIAHSAVRSNRYKWMQSTLDTVLDEQIRPQALANARI